MQSNDFQLRIEKEKFDLILAPQYLLAYLLFLYTLCLLAVRTLRP